MHESNQQGSIHHKTNAHLIGVAGMVHIVTQRCEYEQEQEQAA